MHVLTLLQLCTHQYYAAYVNVLQVASCTMQQWTTFSLYCIMHDMQAESKVMLMQVQQGTSSSSWHQHGERMWHGSAATLRS